MLVEGDKPLLDRLHVVVGAAGGLCPLQQALGHGLVRDLKVEDVLARGNGLLKLLALGHLAGVAVNQEALGAAQLLDHGLGQEVEHSGLVELKLLMEPSRGRIISLAFSWSHLYLAIWNVHR